ncbi:hypothetical protein Dimus_027880 [Dionaea muscipula]
MSGAPRLRSMNGAEDSDQRPVLVPAGNNQARTVPELLKPTAKLPLSRGSEKSPNCNGNGEVPQASSPLSPTLRKSSMPSILRQHGHQLLRSSLSLNASCSSDASSDSTHSRASTGRINRRIAPIRRKIGVVKMEKLDSSCNSKAEGVHAVGDDGLVAVPDGVVLKRRCAWVTPSTDPGYAAFHDEEWGVPVHNDNKLFELLSLSGALAELPWPTLLGKRNTFREVFLDFDPIAVSKLNEKKIVAPGSLSHSLLSELKLRAIIENARQMCKVIDEFGSFDKYIWGFVNHKPVVSRFRYPRQVPVKTPKADFISKDLVRRGFRSVSPTVVYSFMQVAGLTNDHLISCFRFPECMVKGDGLEANNDDQNPEFNVKLELPRALDEMSICSDI